MKAPTSSLGLARASLRGRPFKRVAALQAGLLWLRSAPIARWLTVFVTLVCAAIIGTEIWHEQSEKASEVARVQVASVNLSRSLTQHAEDTVEMASSTLAMLVEQLEREGSGRETIVGLRNLLVAQTSEVSRIHGLFVYDAEGNWLASSAPGNPTRFNNSDRQYFRYHRDHQDLGTQIGSPIRSRSSGQWIVPISRRFNGLDGSFGGVVLATVDVGYFEKYYSTFDVGEAGSILLYSSEGTVLARFPYDEKFIGRDLSRTALFAEHLQSSQTGNYRVKSPLDGVDRIAGYQAGRRYALGTAVAFGEEEALADWRASASRRFAVALILTGLIGALGWIVIRQVSRLQKTRTALVESESKFRLLAENSSDVVALISHAGIRRYVSPSSTRVLGRTPEQLVGTSVFDMIEPGDRSALDTAIAQLRSRCTDTMMVVHQVRRPDGAKIWLESAVRVARDTTTGRADGVVAVSRDITDRKTLEARLESLAKTDGLTELANRREFDERLEFEWRRAARDGTPISLILFDLDRFKRFNDTYGHQAGDQCLRMVSREIKLKALRPADVAARYGGEELALLLPGTHSQGAELVAERIRAAVEGLAIEHRGNAPTEVVTLSAGVATAQAGRAGASPTTLIRFADEALYEAKHNERNRVVSWHDRGATGDLHYDMADEICIRPERPC